MNIFQKIKLLLAIKGPAEEVATDLKGFKAGWQTWSFWTTLLGSLISLGAAANGYMDPKLALITTTVLTALYNIARGLAKSQVPGTKPWWKTTEGWMAIGAQVAGAFLVLQKNGIDPKWLATSATVLTGVMGIARDLANQQPASAPQAAPTTPPVPPQA